MEQIYYQYKGLVFILSVFLTWQTIESFLLDDRCHQYTCSGNGDCSEVNGLVTCHCRRNFAGNRCELTDYCLGLPCRGHSQCEDIKDFPHFMCTCDAGYTGRYCDTKVTGSQSNVQGQTHTANKCDSQYCHHHGDCSEVNGQQTCKCHSGYSGHQCQHQHHKCSESMCSLKGSCTYVNGDTSNIHCHCYPGYYSSRCQHVDVQITQGTCLSSCSGHGDCYNVHGIHVCSCHHNYYGDTCQHILFTTTTSATTTATTTIAPPANTVHHCDRSYCHGYGDCEIIDGQRRCFCYQDFHGDTCQYRSSNHASTDCISEDCSHEGTCYMQDGRPHCQCFSHRYGDYCEFFDYCEAVSPCLNGGTCVNQMDFSHSYSCTCPYGREGSHCENESSTTTTTTTQRSSTTAPTSSVTSTTAASTTQPYPYSHCNKYSTVADLAHNDSVEQRTAFQCSSGSHTGSDAFVIQNCNVNATNQWMQGRQVVTDCSDLPAFTPIATFEGGTFSSQNVAGVFIDCLSNGFRIATQSCDQSPTIVHIANGGSGNLNPNAYYTVQ